MNLPLPPKFTLHHLASPPARVSLGVVTAQRSKRNELPSFNSAEQQNQKRKEKNKGMASCGCGEHKRRFCLGHRSREVPRARLSMGDTWCDLETPLQWVWVGTKALTSLAGSCQLVLRGHRQQKQLHRGRLDVHLLQKCWVQPWTSASFCTGIGDTSAGMLPGNGQANASRRS